MCGGNDTQHYLYYFSLHGTVILSTSVTWTSTTLPVPICSLSVGGHNPHFTDEEVGFSLSIWHSLDLSLAALSPNSTVPFPGSSNRMNKKTEERQAQIVQWVLQDYGKERWRVKGSEGHMVVRCIETSCQPTKPETLLRFWVCVCVFKKPLFEL